MRRVVCDSGPVLHLHEASALDLLESTGEVSIPPAVDDELGRLITDWNRLRPLWIAPTELAVTSSHDWRSWCDAGLLDPGEAQALTLAQHLDADWFLTDDAAARLIGDRLGLEVHGSLGVVLWAGRVRAEAFATLEEEF